MIKEVLRDFIAADSTIANALATYRFTTASAKTPAIFTGHAIPDDAEYPCVFLFISGNTPFETRGNRGTTWRVDCSLYGNREMSDKSLWTIANNIWLRLSRGDIYTTLQIAGYQSFGMYADAPYQAGSGDTFPQYFINVRVDTLKL